MEKEAAYNTQLFIIWIVFLFGLLGILYVASRIFKTQVRAAMHGVSSVVVMVGQLLPSVTSNARQTQPRQLEPSFPGLQLADPPLHVSPAPVVSQVEKADATQAKLNNLVDESKEDKTRRRRQIIEALAVRQKPSGAWYYDTHEIREIVGGDINKVAPMVSQSREAFEAELAAASV